MKKLVLSLASLAVVMVSCSDDDDNSTTTDPVAVVGATLEGGPYTFCVDGVVDNITDDIVSDAGSGETGQLVITNDEGWILGLPGAIEGPDFDAAGVGVCYVYHLNYNGEITGLTGPDADGEPTANIDDLEGDFEFSNFLMVTREVCESGVEAATLEGGPYDFCVDGLENRITDDVVADAGSGETGQLVITNDEGWILGLPGAIEGPDFDGAGVGTCYVYHLNYDGEIVGLTGPDEDGAPTANINDLEGDFELSNFLTVNREDCAVAVTASELVAGESAEDGEYTFTVGDDVADTITDLTLVEGVGSMSTFVVTDSEGVILATPGMSSGPDFDGAGVGTCYLFHVNYDSITGLDVDANINDLEGEFKLSNMIVVNRVAAE